MGAALHCSGFSCGAQDSGHTGFSSGSAWLSSCGSRLLGSRAQAQSFRCRVKESSTAQNSLELKLPSRPSPPFYTEERTFSPKKGMDIQIDYVQLPANPSLWPASGIPQLSQLLKANYSKTITRKNRPRKDASLHVYVSYIYLLSS